VLSETLDLNLLLVFEAIFGARHSRSRNSSPRVTS